MPNFFILRSAPNALATAVDICAGNAANTDTRAREQARAGMRDIAHKGTRTDAIGKNACATAATMSLPESAARVFSARHCQAADTAGNKAGESGCTGLPREFAQHMGMLSPYSIAGATVRAWDEMTGSIVNVTI